MLLAELYWFGRFFMIAIVSIKQLMYGLQIYIYCSIYFYLKDTNSKAKKMISHKSLKSRYRSNTLTVFGQMVGFAADTIMTILAISANLLLNYYGIEGHQLLNIGSIWALFSTIMLFFSCPELRRKYFGEDEKWMPKCFMNIMEPKEC